MPAHMTGEPRIRLSLFNYSSQIGITLASVHILHPSINHTYMLKGPPKTELEPSLFECLFTSIDFYHIHMRIKG